LALAGFSALAEFVAFLGTIFSPGASNASNYLDALYWIKHAWRIGVAKAKLHKLGWSGLETEK
jgi:hypothetical protein